MTSQAKNQLWVLTTEYKPYIVGGLGTVATELTQAFVRRGIEVTVISRSESSNISIGQSKALRIIRFPENKKYFSEKTQNFKPDVLTSALKNRGLQNPMCIHIHSVQFKNIAEFYKKSNNTPVIYTCHSIVSPGKSHKSKRMREKQIKLFRLADAIVVPSRAEMRKVSKQYPFCTGKITVIHHGVSFAPLKSHGDSNQLLFVGRVVRKKGIEELVRATALLARKNKKIRLNVIGTGSARYLSRLKLLSRKLGIPYNVRWSGKQSQGRVQRLYSNYGSVIMPTREESFGLVALEALANGVPLVSTRSGGLSDFVNGKVAQIIPKVNSVEIARSILKMKKNKKLTKSRVKAGRKLALGMSWHQMSAPYVQLFRRVTSARKRL